MKYGICLRNERGEVQYVASSKSYAVFSANIVDIALFAQKETAAKTIARLRKDGHEPKGSEYFIADIQFVVAHETAVERPVVKAGFIIEANGQAYAKGKVSDLDYHSTWPYYALAHVNRATVFPSESQAQERLRDIIAYAERELKELEDLARHRAELRDTAIRYDDQHNKGRRDYQCELSIRQATETANRVVNQKTTIDTWKSAKVIAVG